MRKIIRFSASLLLSAICFLFLLNSKSSAKDEPIENKPAQTHPSQWQMPSDEELGAGLWNDGKAVFSDVKILDIFWKYARGYMPKQPVAFSHNTHVEKNNMECQYCHSGVNKSAFATIPSLESCMGCHKNVLGTTEAQKKEIAKLSESFKKGEPIAWEPVHNLPEHAYFSHERHVKAAVGCQTCHGQVRLMNEAKKMSSLKMGFCVSCHRENGASIDCSVCHQ